jgi:aromatic ring-opening dioxygenase catalytic subunit (LigB family)
MGRVVFAAGVPHVGAILVGIKRAGEQGERVKQAFDRLRDELCAAKPDALIIFGSDHFKSFFYNLVPRFCVGVGTECGAWDEGVLSDVVVETFRVPVHQELARDILTKAVERGFDLNSAEELRLDHSFYSPIERLTPEHDIPIVPLVVNVAIAPRPSLRRCYELGQAIGEIIKGRRDDERIAVIGTGGMSHTVGVPEYGFINPELDREFLNLLASNRADEIIDGWTQELIETKGGNGMNEIRMWLAMGGTVAGATGEVLLYEAMKGWGTGAGLLRMNPETSNI